MLADDEPVHIADGDVRLLGDQIAEPTGVQHRSGSEDVTRCRVDRLGRGQRDDVDRVGDEHDDGVRRMFEQLRCQRPGHRDVGGGEVEAVLSRFLFGTRGDDDDGRAGGHRDVVGSRNPAVRHELAAVVEIEDFGAYLACVDVVESERACRSADQAGIRDGGADASHADDGDLGVLFDRHSDIVAHCVGVGENARVIEVLNEPRASHRPYDESRPDRLSPPQPIEPTQPNLAREYPRGNRGNPYTSLEL